MENGNNRVLVAMSGGVDSSVAAILLRQQGYELVGITMKTWDYGTAGIQNTQSGCCSLDSINDARELAVKMGFAHYVLDLREVFKKLIISNFIDEYLAGRTPNPCVLCNTHVKWQALLEKANQLNCRYIATGHYAQVKQLNDRFYISKGKDVLKDQSYVLYGISQQNLSRTILPLGQLSKEDVRKIAQENGFNKIAQKPESFEICFVPNDDYRSFLRHQIPDLDKRIGEGQYVDKNGNVLGRHQGYPFYTIGQRKGLVIAKGERMYVNKIIPAENKVVLGSRDELLTSEMKVKNVNWQKYADVKTGTQAFVKIRYHDKGMQARLFPQKDFVRVEFAQVVSAVTPGQSAVFYENDDVLGGGIID